MCRNASWLTQPSNAPSANGSCSASPRGTAMSTVGKAGLEDVVVSTSDICFIDGREGRLLYRGYDVDDLVAHSSFEEVVFPLWHGHLRSKKELADFTKALATSRKVSPKVFAMLRELPKKTT